MRTPLLVVHDRDDREVPFGDGAATATAWPDAHLVTTAGLGHRRVLHDPEVVAAIAAVAAGDPPASAIVVDETARLERELANPTLRWAAA